MMVVARIFFFTFIIFFISSNSGFAVKPPPHLRDFRLMTRFAQDFPVRYKISGEVKPDSQLIRGRMDIFIQNDKDRPLEKVLFDLNFRTYDSTKLPEFNLTQPPNIDSVYKEKEEFLVIDTLLYNLVPVETEDITFEHGLLLTITLPTPIPPEKDGMFVFTFVTKLGPDYLDKYTQFYENWLPQLAIGYTEGESPGNSFNFDDRQSFEVGLQIDSAWTIAGSGFQLNEKEHLGFLPEPDSGEILTDLKNLAENSPFGQLFHPVFENGVKKYLWRTAGVGDFSLVVGKDLVFDRTFVDDIEINVVYPEELTELWQGRVAAIARSLVEDIQQYLGEYPYSQLNIVSAGKIYNAVGSETQIKIPPYINTIRNIETYLTFNLPKSWLPIILPSNLFEGIAFDRGLANFVAFKLLYERHGEIGYKMVTGVERFLLKNLQYTYYNQKLLELIFKKYPTQINLIYEKNKDDFWSKFGEFLAVTRYKYTTTKDFFDVFGDKINIYTDTDIDFQILTAGYDVKKHALSLSFSMNDKYILTLPIEIGIVASRGDTLFETATMTSEEEQIELHSEHLPIAVVLDPHDRWPDIDRSNNYYFFRSTRFRYYPPANLFPAYRPLGK